jgi:hypothetical protein
MPTPIRVLQYGLGPIGSAIARHVLERDGLRLVAAVDIDPAKVGRDVGEVIGLARPLGFPVYDRLSAALTHAGADVAIHATTSYFDLFAPQIVELLEAGLDVVSTAEELSFPWGQHPEPARALHATAVRCGKTVLGIGVNPGFLMDTLPIALTALCQTVERVEITRVVNASTRRGPFQAKIGCGMTEAAFRAQMAAGRMGHVGLRQSMDALFDTLGRRLARYEDRVEPLIANRPLLASNGPVAPGQVRGLIQEARGYTDEAEFAVLRFIAALEAGDEQDTIVISGRPTLRVVLQGTNGDLATVAIAVNAIPQVMAAPPGLVTPRDLPPIHHW